MRHLIFLILLFSATTFSTVAQVRDRISQLEAEWEAPSGDVITIRYNYSFFDTEGKDVSPEEILRDNILRVKAVYSLDVYDEYQQYVYEDPLPKDNEKIEDSDDFLLEAKYTEIPVDDGLQFRICAQNDTALVLYPINLKAVKLAARLNRFYLESELDNFDYEAKLYFQEISAAGKGKKRSDAINKWRLRGFYADTLRLVSSYSLDEKIHLDSLLFSEYRCNPGSTEKEEGSIQYRDLVIHGDDSYQYRIVYDILPVTDPRNMKNRPQRTEIDAEMYRSKSYDSPTIEFIPPVVTDDLEQAPIESYESEESDNPPLQVLKIKLSSVLAFPEGLDYYTEGKLYFLQDRPLMDALERAHISTFELPPYEPSWRDWEIVHEQKITIYYNHGQQRTFYIQNNRNPMALTTVLEILYKILDEPYSPLKTTPKSNPHFPESFSNTPVR